jgi:replicative DNA helicase
LEAEQAVLGTCILTAANVADAEEILQPAHFYRDSHAAIFAAMVAVVHRGDPVDTVTVGKALRDAGKLDAVGGLDYLDRLMRLRPLTGRVHAHARIVRDKAALRDLLTAGQSIMQAAQEAETAEEAQARAYELVTTAIGANVTVPDVQVTGPALLATWAERTRVAGEPIPTGFPSLDYALRGGWRRQQVHCLTARTGVGKSSLLCHVILAAIKAGRRVGLASLEMPVEEVTARIVAMETRIPYRECENGPEGIRSPVDRNDARAAAEWIGQSLVVDEASGYGVAEMRRRLLSLRRHWGCDLVILDPFNRVTGNGRSDFERRDSVNDEVQRLAHPDVLGVPFILVCQQNRQGVDGAQLATVKGTGSIEEDSPVVIALERKAKEVVEGQAPEAEAKATLRVLKNRGGRDGLQIPLLGDTDTWAWREAPRQEAEPERAPAARRQRPGRHGVDGERIECDPFA